MKGNIRIATSIVFGIVVVLGALYERTFNAGTAQAEVVTDTAEQRAPAPLRTYIQPEDRDGNGTDDWKDEVQLQKAAEEKVLAQYESVSVDEDTHTVQFTRDFFKDYIIGAAAGEITEENQEDFINASVTTLEQELQDELYTDDDIVIGGSDLPAIRTYGNIIAEILFRNAVTSESDAVLNILDRYLTSNNESDLEAFDPIIESYRAYLDETTHAEVPLPLVDAHLDLINTYNAILQDLIAFRNSPNDPLLSVLRASRFEDDALGFQNALLQIFARLHTEGARYEHDEPAEQLRTSLIQIAL